MLDAAVASGGRLAGVIVASPSNPCGTMLSPRELFALRDWCVAHGAWLISDEIYHRLVYGALRDATALEPTARGDDGKGDDVAAAGDDAAAPRELEELSPAADVVVVINSFSKYYSMTGALIKALRALSHAAWVMFVCCV
jgi:aspartate/methionine/tyrosine aminotransferase